MFRQLYGFLIVTLCALVAGCASGGAESDLVSAEQRPFQAGEYKLGPSDKIRLIVYGEPELSGEFSINTRGQISLPLLGEIDAQGQTIDELRTRIARGLSAGYVNNARVAAEIVAYRPYYILGEVGMPGEYPYSAGMTVIKAVATAKGFSYRANKSSVFIKRTDESEEIRYRLTPDLMVYPGDVVRVGERFF